MLHKAYEILQDYHLAEDAASEAFIRIHRNIHKIDDPTDKRSIAFIVTIVKNVSLTILKSNLKKLIIKSTNKMSFSIFFKKTVRDCLYENKILAHANALPFREG